MSKKIHFRYRTFRFQNIKTIDQRQQIHCRLHLTTEETIIGSIQNCTCYSNESCDSGAWSYWSDCDGDCKQTRIRNKDEADEETESRDCQGLCFFNVNDDIDENLKTCSIDNNRSRRDIPKQIARLSNGSTAYPGSLPYVVRLTFQTFDQFHSDSQACFLKILKIQLRNVLFWSFFRKNKACNFFVENVLSNIISVQEQLFTKIGFWQVQHAVNLMI